MAHLVDSTRYYVLGPEFNPWSLSAREKLYKKQGSAAGVPPLTLSKIKKKKSGNNLDLTMRNDLCTYRVLFRIRICSYVSQQTLNYNAKKEKST